MSSIKSIFLFISTLHISNRLNTQSTVDFKFRVGGERKQAVGWKGLILVNFFSLMTLSRVCDICISIYIRLDWATFLLLQLLFFNYVVLFKGPETEVRWRYRARWNGWQLWYQLNRHFYVLYFLFYISQPSLTGLVLHFQYFFWSIFTGAAKWEVVIVDPSWLQSARTISLKASCPSHQSHQTLQIQCCIWEINLRDVWLIVGCLVSRESLGVTRGYRILFIRKQTTNEVRMQYR